MRQSGFVVKCTRPRSLRLAAYVASALVVGYIVRGYVDEWRDDRNWQKEASAATATAIAAESECGNKGFSPGGETKSNPPPMQKPSGANGRKHSPGAQAKLDKFAKE